MGVPIFVFEITLQSTIHSKSPYDRQTNFQQRINLCTLANYVVKCMFIDEWNGLLGKNFEVIENVNVKKELYAEMNDKRLAY
ncbi:hypothetical protein CSV73_09580 [Sporosarcina sp. P1]|nr:hypothetical protein CSV73_09580 [Sporosarcina sp. P1]